MCKFSDVKIDNKFLNPSHCKYETLDRTTKSLAGKLSFNKSTESFLPTESRISKSSLAQDMSPLASPELFGASLTYRYIPSMTNSVNDLVNH